MDKAVAVEQVDVLQVILQSQLTEARKALGLSQAEVAERIGSNRITVQRAESDGADPKLSTFLSMALAVGLAPSVSAPDATEIPPLPCDLVHRGFSHVRTKYDLEYSDRRREAALAASWEAANVDEAYGLGPVLPSLIPNCTQDQASACATVVQWLGSENGFEFLSRTLALAGYAIVESSTASTSLPKPTRRAKLKGFAKSALGRRA